MDIKYQVSLVVLGLSVLVQHNRTASLGNDPEERKSPVPGLASTSASATNREPSSLPGQKLVVTVTLPAKKSALSSQQVREDLLRNERFEIARDLDIDQNIEQDFNFLFSIADKERDFLLHEVGISPEKYQKILEQKRIVQWQLSKAAEYARSHGYNLHDVKRSILSKHILWMQTTIGVGYYTKLQELAYSSD